MDKRPIQVTGSSLWLVLSPSMKTLTRLIQGSSLILCLLLASCSQQTGQISSLKEQITAMTDANKARQTEIQDMKQKTAVVSRENKTNAAKRNEFKAQADKSSATAKLMSAYRADLEKSLKDLTDATASYRSKYLAP
jgi:regulator of replication initiation timing